MSIVQCTPAKMIGLLSRLLRAYATAQDPARMRADAFSLTASRCDESRQRITADHGREYIFMGRRVPNVPSPQSSRIPNHRS